MNKLFIFIIIFIFLIFLKNRDIEGYDVRISDLSATECGDTCTTGYGCSGFSHDQKTNKCYLSQTRIFGKPNSGQFISEYTAEQKRCNKRSMIKEGDSLDLDSKKENIIYMCAPQENVNNDWYVILNDNFVRLDSPYDDLEKLGIMKNDIEKYELNLVEWPTKNSPKIDTKPIYLDRETNKHDTYLISQKGYVGDFLYDHECVAKIPLFDCLKNCSSEPECIGVESRSNDICCPIKKVNQNVDKKIESNKGLFYEKLNEDGYKTNKNKDGYLILR